MQMIQGFQLSFIFHSWELPYWMLLTKGIMQMPGLTWLCLYIKVKAKTFDEYGSWHHL